MQNCFFYSAFIQKLLIEKSIVLALMIRSINVKNKEKEQKNKKTQ